MTPEAVSRLFPARACVGKNQFLFLLRFLSRGEVKCFFAAGFMLRSKKVLRPPTSGADGRIPPSIIPPATILPMALRLKEQQSPACGGVECDIACLTTRRKSSFDADPLEVHAS